MSTSVTNIQNRLHSGEYGVNIVAFSNEIATPTDPLDLEHSAFTRQSDINEELSRKTRLHKIPVNLLQFTEEDPVVSLSNADLIDLLGCNASEFESSFANTEVVFSVQEKKYTQPKTFAILSEYTKDNTNVHRFVGIDGNLTIVLSFLIAENQQHVVQYTEGFLEVHETETTVTDAVKYTQQSLTVEQQAQARQNIGVTSIDVQDGSVTTSKLANGAVTGAKIAEGTITSENLAPGIEIPYNITDGSVTTAKLHDGAVTSAKLDSSIANAVSAVSGKQDQLVSGTNIKTVNSQSLLGSGNIEISTTIADGSITTAKLANNAITSGKLSSDLQNTINGKANTNSLAEVATTGNYRSLLNIPSNIAYLGNYPNQSVIPNFDPYYDCLRVNNSQELSSTQSENAKSNVFNKDAQIFSTDGGYSIKYLKQNIVSNENVLTQNDFSDSKTVYIIDYDFKIDGSTYTDSDPLILPADSILLFLSGGFYGGGYVDLNEAEVYPSYSRLYKILDTTSTPSRVPIRVAGGIKEGTIWYDETEKKIVTYNGNSIVYADGIIYGDSFSKTTQTLPNWNTDTVKYPIGYMYYYGTDLYIITGYTVDAGGNPNGYDIKYVSLTNMQ